MARRKRTPEEMAADDAKQAMASRDYHADVRALLKKGGVTIAEVAKITGLPESLAKAVITDIQHGGHNVQMVGERITITGQMPAAKIHGPHITLETDDDGWIHFGALGDTHLCSKYERLDVLNDMYDRFAAEGVKYVFHTGNWIDGEHSRAAPAHELLAHGIEGQCEYMAENYPVRKGIDTYAVAGDDHEGWYQQREGVDIGRYAERVMREFGRTDWHHMGYQSAHVLLKNKQTGKSCVMGVEHPGGGSSYADSYALQKIIEALDSGEKPAIILEGHYHKLIYFIYRGVHAFCTACTKDRDSFAKKKKLRYVLGGWYIRLHLDKHGAIDRIIPEAYRYFNKGYYQGQNGLKPTKGAVSRTP